MTCMRIIILAKVRLWVWFSSVHNMWVWFGSVPMWVWLSGVLGHRFGTGSTLDGLGGVQCWLKGLFHHHNNDNIYIVKLL